MSCSFSKEACVPECPAKKLLTESWQVREIMVKVLDKKLGEQAAHKEADRTFRLNEEFAEFFVFSSSKFISTNQTWTDKSCANDYFS